jgi:hypothetical protein
LPCLNKNLLRQNCEHLLAVLFEIFLAFFGAGGLAPIKAKAIGRVLTGDIGSALVSLRRIYFKFCGKTDIYNKLTGE